MNWDSKALRLLMFLAVFGVAFAGVTNLDSLTLDSDLIVGDDATITDDLTVTGAATIGETLAVTGAVTLTGGVTGAVAATGAVSGTTGTFTSTLAVTGATTLTGGVNGAMAATGAVSGTTITGSGAVSGATVDATGALTGNYVGVDGCPDLASATTIAPVASCHNITGSTEITNFTTGSFTAGDLLVLNLEGTAQITEGNGLVMAGNLVSAATDSITFMYIGTKFVELSRSDNSP